MIAAALQDIPQPVHEPQVAGSFYPANPAELSAQLSRCLLAGKRASIAAPKMVIAPHAGLIFSGGVAASAFGGLAARDSVIRRVVIIGPAHRHAFKGLALHPARAWRTPLGDIAVDTLIQRRLTGLEGVAFDEVPFRGEHSIEILLPFLQISLTKAQIIPILVGDAPPQLVAEALERVWGGPETLIVISSDLSHYMAEQAAKDHDSATRRLIETMAGEQITADRACGHRAIAGALLLARRHDLRINGIDFTTSGDVTNDHARVVGYGAFTFEYAAQARLSEGERKVLLQTAARSLAYAVANGGQPPKLTINGSLPLTFSAMRATFVTLDKDKRLRGCIGSLQAHRPLLADVVANTVKAGFSDPRFPALLADELPAMDLSVSILSQPRAIEAASEPALIAELSPDRDGLIIADQGRSALFLPHVWAQIPDPRIFLSALRQKAGLRSDHWSPTFRAQRFTVEKFGGSIRELLANAPR